MAQRKLRPVVNVSPDGKTSTLLRVQDTAILPLIVAMELPVTYLGKGKTAYVEIGEVIGWHERELPRMDEQKEKKEIPLRAAWIARLKEIAATAA